MIVRSKGLGLYILQGKLAVPVDSIEEWARKFERSNRHVASTKVGGIWISTVFLGLDHSFGNGEPQIFETMAFGGGDMRGLLQERYATWDEAAKGHKAVVAQLRKDIKERVND